MVYVLGKSGNPLMPTYRHGSTRRWLRDKKAAVIRSYPFTIKLLVPSEEKVQEVKASIVPSSRHVGIAAAANGKCLFSSEIELRKDISKRMKRRSVIEELEEIGKQDIENVDL